MFRNYLSVALRALKRQRLYAFLNVFGLALGLCCAILIYLFVKEETSFDDFHAHRDRIYRMVRQTINEDGNPSGHDVYLPLPLAKALEEEMPEVEATVRLSDRESYFQVEGITIEESGLLADAEFFNVFSFPLVQGNPSTALSTLNQVVLTQSLAQQLFGEQGPEVVGRSLKIRLGDSFEEFTVSALAYDPPSHSSLRFSYIMPFDHVYQAFPWVAGAKENWNSSAWITYALLREGASVEAFQGKMQAFRKRHYPDELEDYKSERGWKSDVWPATYYVQPLAGMHWQHEIRGGITKASNPQYSLNLGLMALALLLIAAINFMTLAIGRSAQRGKEVAMRKVIGAERLQVMGQFWLESVLFSTMALVLGVLLAALLLPFFNQVAKQSLSIFSLFEFQSMAVLVGLTLFTGVLAGSYPALVLSNFKPLAIFRQGMKLGGSNWFTRSLVVLQFSISAAFLLGTYIMMMQLNFLRTKDLGFNGDQIVVLPNETIGEINMLEHFQNALIGDTRVEEVAGALVSFGRGSATTGWTFEEEIYRAKIFPSTANYAETLELTFVEGRDFDPQLATDSSRVIVNEAFLEMFNWDHGVGQTIPGFEAHQLDNPEILGVVKNYQFQSLEREVEPVVIYMAETADFYQLFVKLRGSQLREGLDLLENTWDELAAGSIPFEYSFLNDDMANMYEEDARWGKIISGTALLTLAVACMGLFGLAALTIRGRTKELSIRKVLGAGGRHLSWVISKQLALLMGIGVLLGIPVAAWMMDGWLADYAYRVELPFTTYLLPILSVAAIGIVTLAYHLVRAQRVNPALAMRES